MTGDPAAASGAAPPRCAADYFDGLQARAQPVTLTVRGRQLHIDGEGVALQVPVRRVSWPERQRHGARHAYLPGQGMLSCADAGAWDAWTAASGLRERLLVRWMQSWRGVLLALLLLLGALFGAFRWGLPWAAQGVVALTPLAVDRQLGALVLDAFEREWLKPSQLPPAQQAALRAQFEQALRRLSELSLDAPPAGSWTLHFRATPPRGGLGANAFALPGGDIVVTDEMVRLLADRPDVLVGVLGHELGHVQQRHAMRMVVQASLLAAASSLLVGDFSSLLAAAPVLLGQAAYSRDFEFEADHAAARLMRANGIAPSAFGVLFERIAVQRAKHSDAVTLPIGLSSHPPDAERVRRMSEAEGA